MKPIGILLICAGVSAAQPPAAGPGPQVPYEDAGACPFEGCVYRTWTANRAVVVRRQRRAAAPVAFRLTKGTRVQALTGVVVTTKAGRVEFSEPFDTRQGLVIQPGETLYLLTYQGEGFTKAWFRGRLLVNLDVSEFFNNVCDVRPERCKGRVEQPWTRTWWVQIENSRGRVGWSNEPESFDGKNAIGG